MLNSDGKGRETGLREAKAYLENIIRSTADIVVVVDYDGAIRIANEATVRILGYETRADLTGQSVSMLFAEQQKGEKFYEGETLGLLLQDGFVSNLRAELRARDGRLVPIFFSGSVMRTDENKILGFVIVAKDITELVKVEKMKDEFLGSVSHELRTPLSIIMAAISNLRDGIAGPLLEKQAEIVEMTGRQCSRLARLIEDLLDLSRLESGRSGLHVVCLSLPALIREIVGGFRAMINGEKDLVEDLPENLPDIHADREMLARLLTNLIQNAVHFAKKKIVVKAGNCPSPGEEWVQVSVIDDGCGIPEGEQGNLFNKFVQLHRPEGGAGYKGTGLGLAICKNIITKHGGKIWVESHAGGGAAFCWTIPVKNRERGMKKGNGKKKILLVDDERDLVLLLQLRLESTGEWVVITAHDGAEAMEKVKEERPDLIVLDVVMPGENGFEVCRQIKGEPSTRSIPVILVTAKTREDDRICGKEAGSDAYMTKPFEVGALIEKMNELLCPAVNA